MKHFKLVSMMLGVLIFSGFTSAALADTSITMSNVTDKLMLVQQDGNTGPCATAACQISPQSEVTYQFPNKAIKFTILIYDDMPYQLPIYLRQATYDPTANAATSSKFTFGEAIKFFTRSTQYQCGLSLSGFQCQQWKPNGDL